MRSYTISFLFFFNDTATTEIYTLSLHDALPIYCPADQILPHARRADLGLRDPDRVPPHDVVDPEVRRRVLAPDLVVPGVVDLLVGHRDQRRVPLQEVLPPAGQGLALVVVHLPLDALGGGGGGRG